MLVPVQKKKRIAFFQRAGAGERLAAELAAGAAAFLLPTTDEPANLSVRPFTSSCSSIRDGFPSKTPWISDIVLSRLLLLLLGLVIVVPKLACLTCPFLDAEGEIGLMGEGCEREDVAVLMREGMALAAMAFSRLSATPFGAGGGCSTEPSAGVLGSEEDPKIALPSSESASKRSGGRRSFSMSDLRLQGKF